MKDIPPVQLGRAIKYFLQGRLHFDKDVIGQILSEDDEEKSDLIISTT